MYEELFYPIRKAIPKCPTDTHPTVTTHKRGAGGFLKWESRTRTFVVEPDVAGKDAVGTHTI